MKTAILLSIYNGYRFVGEQIDSISKQTFIDWELIIRDDGSTDLINQNSKKILNKYYEKVKLLSDSVVNLGALASYSILTTRADADYIFFCDQDDVWHPDKIEKTIEVMIAAEKQFGADIPLLVHTDLSVVDRDLHLIASSLWEYQNLNPHLGSRLNRIMPQNCVTGCTVMINRPLAELAMPIAENAIMHDWWLALVAAAFGQIVYLDEPTVLYRQHGTNSIGAKRWGLKRIVEQTLRAEEVRSSILQTIQQAKLFLDRFSDKMTSTQIAMVEAYASLPLMSKTARLTTVFKYGFFKHGIIRNIGFLLNLLIIERPRP